MDAFHRLYPRLIEHAMGTALADTPVVCLLGPRQCGKTTLVQAFAPGRAYVSLDDEGLLATARQDPVGFVAALPDPVTIDEVQLAPALLRAIKATVDRDRRPGRFLLTGSANLLLLPTLSDSLAGRMEILHLHPLTEAEKERQPGSFLRAFLQGEIRPLIVGDGVPIGGLAERLVAGGYPEPLTRPPARATRWHRNYLSAIIERDVADIARVNDAHHVARLLGLLAQRTAELLNISATGGALGLDRKTVEHYLAILERLFLVRRLSAWHHNAGKRLIKTPKVHLLDSGLAATLAGLQPEQWNARRERFGHLLESFVVQQVIAQAAWTDPALEFWHYRDKDQVEVDLVITRGRETWGIEVKTSATVNTADGQGLRRLASQCGKDFKGGILLHSGSSILPLGDSRLLAAPTSMLWEM
jgi:predicted AAA+ superfamily ATPase